MEAFLSVFLLLLSGGIGGWTVLAQKDLTWDTIMHEDWMQKTANGEELYWFSVICHVLLPQRSALFAYPIDCLIFICLYMGITGHHLRQDQRQFMFSLSGVLMGLLPLVHIHSFVSVGTIALVFCLLQGTATWNLKKDGHFRLWLRFAIPIILLALPQIPHYLDRIEGGDSDGSSFIKFVPLWHNSPWRTNVCSYFTTWPWTELNSVIFWFRTLGFMVPLSLLGIWYLPTVQQKKFYLAFIALFVVGNVVMFQPWDKDNNKVFIVWLILAAGVVSKVLLHWKRKNILGKIVVPFLIFSLVASGFLISLREYHLRWRYMEKQDIEFGEWVRDHTPADSIFITSEYHIHPVTNLAGRTQLYGFGGWVHSHGYPEMWQRQNMQKRMLKKPQDFLHNYREYNISYIAVDENLKKETAVDVDWFNNNPKVKKRYSSPKWTLFDIRKLVNP